MSCPTDCTLLSCGNSICDKNENEEICPTDCNPVVCGDRICEIGLGENYKNCPLDCYKGIAKCGDKKCEYAENQENCCTDCGCKMFENCVKNKCEKFNCCLFGIYYSFLGICWYLWIILIGSLGIAYYFIKKFKKTRKKYN